MPPIDTNGYAMGDRYRSTLDSWITRAREVGYVAFDTETDSLEAVTARLVGFSVWPWHPVKRVMCRLAHGGY